MFEAGWALLEQLKNRHFSLLLFKIWPYLCASSSSDSCHSQAWALFQVFLNSLGTSLSPRVLPCRRNFFASGFKDCCLKLQLFLLLKGGLLLVWIFAGGSQSRGSNLCTWAELGHFMWHLATRRPKHSCPYTQPCLESTWKKKNIIKCI